jgi:hypothetical protein
VKAKEIGCDGCIANPAGRQPADNVQPKNQTARYAKGEHDR